MGFMDFWNDLWDGGGIGQSGAQANAKPKRKPVDYGKLNKNAGMGGYRSPERGAPIAPTQRTGKGSPISRGQVKKAPVDNWAISKPFINREKYRTGPEYIANQEKIKEDNLIEELLGQINGGGGGGLGDLFQDQSGFLNQSREAALKALSDALTGNLSALNNVRSSARDNFKTSDANLQAMHNAFQRDISTNGRKAFEGIRDEHVGNIEDSTESGTNRLADVRRQQLAERAAMLKNLGIEAAGEDQTHDFLNEGIGYINKTGANSEQFANEMGAANIARNQGMATAVGNEGLERRSDLQSQLDMILNNLGMQEATVRNNFNTQKSELEMGFGEQQNALQMQQREMEMEQNQADLESARMMLNDIYERRAAAAQSQEEAEAERRKFEQSLARMEFEYKQKGLLADRNAQLKAQFQ